MVIADDATFNLDYFAIPPQYKVRPARPRSLTLAAATFQPLLPLF